MRRWAARITIALVLIFIVSFALVGVATEGALHPLLRRRATDTAGLAQSSADAISGTARQITIRAKDGTTLKAWWIMPPHWDGRAVIVCHGVADSGFGAMGFALLFLRHGYATLVPDSRGHGESGGFVSYGVYESHDTVQWLAWLDSQGVKRVYGMGESLGAAILLQSLADGAHFDALVADSAYSSFQEIARERVARRLRTPEWLVWPLAKESLLYARVAHHVSLSEAHPAEAVHGNQTPILLIHGQDDRETSPINSERIFRNTPCSQLWLVPRAKHTGAYATAPREFESRVLAWFARY